MFETIVVPVDLRDERDRAVSMARDLAVPGRTSILLLHVIETIKDTEFEEIRDFYEKIEAAARARLGERKQLLDNQNIKSQLEVVYGEVAAEIVKFAAIKAADLVVMKSHKINPQAPGEGWGTTSYKVAILAQCPVMLVK